jgi:peptidoglycan/LPS O-acetylase OafA/YrhL
MKKRFFRIYPIFWIVFLLVLISAYLIPSLRGTLPNDFLIIVKSLLLFPQDKSIVGGTGSPIIIVAWTLQYEMLFYLCFGLLILNAKIAMLLGLVAMFILVKWVEPTYLTQFIYQDYLLLCKIAILLGLQKYGFFGALITFITIFIIYLFSSLIFHLRIEKPMGHYLKKRFI